MRKAMMYCECVNVWLLETYVNDYESFLRICEYTIAKNFRWTNISPSPATFALQKYSAEQIFANV